MDHIADDDIINLRSMRYRWGDCAGEALDARKWFLKRANNEAGKGEEWPCHRDWFLRAAKALNALLAEAMAHKHDFDVRIAAYEEKHRPRQRTDEEMLALGKEVMTDPTLGGMMRQGRALTNIEFSAILMFTTEDEVTRFAASYLQWVEHLAAQRAP